MKQQSQLKICVAGAHEPSSCGTQALEAASDLGKHVAHAGHILTLGATTGFPLWAAIGARDAGGTAIGFSPAASADEHNRVYRLPGEHMNAIIYTGFGFAGADLLLMRSSDAVIFGCGKVGTLHEFLIAFQEGKPIGVLEGDWQTDELIRDIIAGNKEIAHENIVFEKDPKKLVEQVVALVKK